MDLNTVQPGAVIDRYTVEATIGQGGMALVLKVRHNQLGTAHALKVLTITSPSVMDRLVQEGRVQASLRHPNVVTVTDLVTLPSGSPGLVMELVEGPTLEQLLLAGRLSFAQADVLARGILEGVAEAHRLGLVHRDLKPANILLEPGDGTYVPKVADFGLAKVLEADVTPGRTRTGVTMGTPQYMAPEQVRDSKNVGTAADVFALGAILYELVTGSRAFDHEDDLLEIFNAVANGRYVPVKLRTPNVPPSMAAAIEAALQVDPARRPPDVDALRALWVDGRGSAPALSVFPDVARVVSLSASHQSWGSGSPTLDREPAPPNVPPAAPSSEALAGQRAVALAGGGLVFAMGGLALLGAAVVGLAITLSTADPESPGAEAAVVAGTPEPELVAGAPAAMDVAVDEPSGSVASAPPAPDPVAVDPEPIAPVVVEPAQPGEPVDTAPAAPPGDVAPPLDAEPEPPAPGPGDDGAKLLVQHLANVRDRDSCVQLGKLVQAGEDLELRRLAWVAVRGLLERGLGDTIVLQDIVAGQLKHGRPRMAAEAAATLGTTATRPELLFPGLEHASTVVKLATLDAVGEMSQRVPDQRWWFKVKQMTRSSRPRVANKAKTILDQL